MADSNKTYTFKINYGNYSIIFKPRTRQYTVNGHSLENIDTMVLQAKKDLLEAYYSVAPIWKTKINYKTCLYYVEYNPDTNLYWYDIKDRVAKDDILKYDKNWIGGEAIVESLKLFIDDAYKYRVVSMEGEPMGDSIYATSDSKAICQCDLNEVFHVGHEFNCPEENVKKRKPAS